MSWPPATRSWPEAERGVRRRAVAHRRARGRPAEDRAVEGGRLVEGARAQLSPAELVHAVGVEAVHAGRLPGGDEGAAGILEDRHAALVAHVERRGDDGAAGRGDPVAEGRRVGRAQVDHPAGRGARRLDGTDAGHVAVGVLGDGVAAVLGVGRHIHLPAEQARVEGRRRGDVGAGEVHPGGLVDVRRCGLGHVTPLQCGCDGHFHLV